jgi:hypothetical protein
VIVLGEKADLVAVGLQDDRFVAAISEDRFAFGAAAWAGDTGGFLDGLFDDLRSHDIGHLEGFGGLIGFDLTARDFEKFPRWLLGPFTLFRWNRLPSPPCQPELNLPADILIHFQIKHYANRKPQGALVMFKGE